MTDEQRIVSTTQRGVRGVRGIRGVAVVLGGVSLLVVFLGLLMFIVSRSRGGLGYNSGMTALIAAGHVVLSVVCLVVVSGARRLTRFESFPKAVLSCYLFVTLVVYLELVAGFVYPRDKPARTPYVSEPDVGWRLRPNYTGIYLDTELSTNSDGFRSPEIEVVKPPDGKRVVCLGDSLTFGHGVPVRETYPARLANELRDRMRGSRWEVINTGMEGYCTFQETSQLRRCLKYQPDVAVLLFCLNDVTEKYKTLRRFGGTGLDYHGVIDGGASKLLLYLARVRKYSSLITAIMPDRASSRRQEEYSVAKLWTQPEAPHVQAAWEQAEKELDELRAVCDENGVALIVAVAPFREQLTDAAGIDAPQRILADYSNRHGVRFVDLRPSFLWEIRHGKSVEQVFMDSSHPTPFGYTLVAGLIADEIESLLEPTFPHVEPAR